MVGLEEADSVAERSEESDPSNQDEDNANES
jgi:hypothetical protein